MIFPRKFVFANSMVHICQVHGLLQIQTKSNEIFVIEVFRTCSSINFSHSPHRNPKCFFFPLKKSQLNIPQMSASRDSFFLVLLLKLLLFSYFRSVCDSLVYFPPCMRFQGFYPMSCTCKHYLLPP